MKITVQIALEEAENPDTFRRCANIPTSSRSEVTLPTIPTSPKNTEMSSLGKELVPTFAAGKSKRTPMTTDVNKVHQAQNRKTRLAFADMIKFDHMADPPSSLCAVPCIIAVGFVVGWPGA